MAPFYMAENDSMDTPSIESTSKHDGIARELLSLHRQLSGMLYGLIPKKIPTDDGAAPKAAPTEMILLPPFFLT